MHYSVLKKESIENLNIKSDGIYVDGTIGLAGHSSEILKLIPDGFLYGFDQDEYAVLKSEEKLSQISNNYNYKNTYFCFKYVKIWYSIYRD